MRVVLIVVQSPEQRAQFNQALRGTVLRLVYALDGEDGFDRFNEVRPDLVLAHLEAPRLDGTILCQLIRQQMHGAVPILLISEDLDDNEAGIARAHSLGADGVIHLPLERTRLTATLDRFLGRATAPAPTQDFEPPTTSIPANVRGAPPMPLRLSVPPPTERLRASNLPPPVALDPEDSEEIVIPVEDAGEEMPTSLTSMPDLDEQTGTADLAPQLVDPPELMAPKIPFSDTAGLPAPMDPASSGERAASMLDEPMLPVASIGRMAALEGDGATNRVAQDALIEELPREMTPSRDGPSVPVRGAGRGRKGLDESQLGKRLVRRVQQVHQLMPELSYYQLLGVEPNANAQQIKASYFELALEFHPDRFLLLRSGDIKEKIYAVFRRVNEAYTVLSDERRRAAYDETTLGRKPRRASEPAERQETARPAPDPRFEVHTQTPQAKRFVQLALTSYRTEAYDDARLFLLMALGLEPQNATIRRAMDEASRKRSRASFVAMSARPSIPPSV
ncbi:MAG: DnaJ domain-containing protein [Myxococcota bacterium]